MMDAILEVPMTEVLEKVPLDQQTKAVLMGGTGLLRPVYRLMLAQESGQWDLAKIIATVPGNEAFRPLAEGGCPLAAKK